ncbi:MAG: LamG domain-containing protein [Pirellulales bacterium]
MRLLSGRFLLLGAAAAWTIGSAGFAVAAGVPAGSSILFTIPDYTDTFTGTDSGGIPGRPYIAAGLPDYPIENNFGNPRDHFIQQAGSAFSIASDAGPGFVQGGAPAYPVSLGANASGAGSDTGFTQTGGNNLGYGVEYWLRDEYVVQVDAIQVTDRVDITSGDLPTGGHIFTTNSISVFFRGDGSGGASVFNGATDTPIPGINTGIAAWNAAANGGQSRWYNYAVRFNQPANEIELYVDQVSLGVVDLNTFAGGIYSAGFSNHFVGVSTNTGDRTWTDNFQVGGDGAQTGMPPVPPEPHPNPGVIPGLPAGLVSFWDFDEADGPVPGRTLNFAYDRAGGENHGSFVGTTERAPGLVGVGSARLHDAAGEGVNAGPGVGNNFSMTDGITVETLFVTSFDGSDQAEFFRKEDGGNRILLSFQSDANTNNAFGQLIGSDAGFPGISLGLNTGGYAEMDVALDGLGGRPSLAQIADGNVHHLAATYDAATGVRAMYIDGVLVGSFDGADNVPILSGGAAAAFIGSSNGGEPFPGTLDEVAVWNRALSASEIQFHFANAMAGNSYFVPEPGTTTLAVFGMLGLCGLGLRRRRNK